MADVFFLHAYLPDGLDSETKSPLFADSAQKHPPFSQFFLEPLPPQFSQRSLEAVQNQKSLYFGACFLLLRCIDLLPPSPVSAFLFLFLQALLVKASIFLGESALQSFGRNFPFELFFFSGFAVLSSILKE